MQTKSILAILIAALTTLSIDAFAALPTAATTAFTALQSDAEDLIDATWPVAIAVTVGFIILGLFKRAARSAV